MKSVIVEGNNKASDVNNIQVAAESPTIKLIKTKGKVEGIYSIGQHMSKEHGIAEKELYLFSQAVTPAKIQGREGVLVRVFAPEDSKAKGVQRIEDFDSLDKYPELILYDGYYLGPFTRGIPSEICIEKRMGTGPSFVEKKLQDGSITEVGMKKAPGAAMKWLGRFGYFLMMGGWLLLVVVVLGIVIAISVHR